MKIMCCQENKPLISIIVPIYQVEKYLDKCILSIINQSYKNIELILIDDGSTDNCPEICDKYQRKDVRVKVIHKTNEGLSQARNDGLKIARGDFIGFVDSDDWIEPNMYEVLLTTLMKTKADIAICNRMLEYDNSNNSQIYIEPYNINNYSPNDILEKIIKNESFIKSAVWNKLYKTSIIKDIEFPKKKIFEDIIWTAKAIGNAKIITCIDCSLYHHLIRFDSLSHNKIYFEKGLYDRIEIFEQRIIYFHKNFPILERKAILLFLHFCYIQYFNICLNYSSLDNNHSIRSQIHNHFKKFKLQTLLYGLTVKKTIKYIIFYFYPNLLLKFYILKQSKRQ